MPFGEDLASLRSSVAIPSYGSANFPTQKFTGKERDAETGLDYFGARYFSAAQGRWTSPDWSATPTPIPYAILSDPQTLNLYAYVRNNPLNIRDFDGHGWWGDLWKGLADHTYRPLVTMVRHPIVTARNLGSAITHPVATANAIRHGVVTTTVSVLHGNGEAIGTAIGTVGMAFIPGAGEAGDGAEAVEAVAGAGKLGEAAEATEAVLDAEPAVNTAGYGNIAGGETVAGTALTQAEKWLGPGYKEIAPGVYRSADGTRQFRMTTSDLMGSHGNIGSHVHFETIGPDGRTITENSHVAIKP